MSARSDYLFKMLWKRKKTLQPASGKGGGGEEGWIQYATERLFTFTWYYIKVLITQAWGCWVTAALSCPSKANETDTGLSLLSVLDDFSQTRHLFYRFFSHLLPTLSLTASDFNPEFPFPDFEGTVWGQRRKVRLTFDIPCQISRDKPWISAAM